MTANRRRKTPAAKDTDNRLHPVMVGVSLFIHAVIFGLFFVVQSLSLPLPEVPVVRVDLVSLDAGPPVEPVAVQEEPPAVSEPEPPAQESSGEVLPEQGVEENPQPRVVQDPVPVQPIEALPPEEEIMPRDPEERDPMPSPEPEPAPVREVKKFEPPEKKRSLKKKTYRPDKVIAAATRQLKKAVKKTDDSRRLESALQRMQDTVDETGNKNPALFGAAEGTSGAAGGDARAIDLYNLELMYRIQQNWAFNPQLAGAGKDLEVRILIKVLKSGHIRDIWFETRSGNRLLDDSALKAVKKSNPLAPLPRGYESYDVGLIFTPSGLM